MDLKGIAKSGAGWITLLLLTALTVILSSGISDAETFVVTSLNNSGAGTLRQAIIDANGNADADNVVRFSGELNGVILLTSGEILITKSVSVIGPGPQVLTVSGNNSSRVFHITGTGLEIAFSDLTISNGRAYDIAQSKYDFGGGIYFFGGGTRISLNNTIIEDNRSGAGGGIYASGGTVAMTNSTVRNNQVLSPSTTNPYGGGIHFNGSNATIKGSTISGNTSSTAGGIIAWGGTLDISNSTVSGNTATSNGGGIYSWNTGVKLSSITLTANTGGGLYAGSYNGTHASTITNSIISNNLSPDNCSFGQVTPVSGGGNIDSGSSCGLSGAYDQQNTNPSLASLADNGGPTLTHAITAGSPAIDGGVGAGAPNVDQRGWPRPAGTAVDSGAVEHMDYRTLTVGKTGTGTGRVMSSPGGLDCGISCASDATAFPFGGTVSITAVPAGPSIFSGWSGTGCGDLITMDTDRTCTASFTLCGGDPVAATPTVANNTSIMAAYAAGIYQDQQLKVTALDQIGDLDLHRTVNLKLYGGYDCSFQYPPGGFTYISGMVTISNDPGQSGGSVTMDRIIIL
jgi:parallel beta-helix repeat protein